MEWFELPAGPEIACGDFLRRFLQIGIEKREKDRIRKRKQQEQQEQRERDEEEAKVKQKADYLNFQIDYDFSEVDDARAQEKIKDASTKYDKSLPGSKSLDCFEVDHLSPGLFRDALRRTFDLHFTDKEMGALVRRYDKENKGHILCIPFTTMFLRIGQEERFRLHHLQLEKQRRLIAEAAAEEERKLKEAFEKKNFQVYYEFEDHHLQSALAKLQKVSAKFDRARGAGLDSFEPDSLTPLQFHEALQRTFNLTLGPYELGAVICTFDKDETGKIHCKTFLNSFFSLGQKLKDKVRMC